MSEIGGEIPIQVIENLDKSLISSPLVVKAIAVAELNGNLIDKSSKQGRLSALIGDELHGGLDVDTPDRSLYGEIFNNPNEKDREQRVKNFKQELLYPSVLIDKDHVPDSYFELQLRIAEETNRVRELGWNNVTHVPEETRKKAGELIYTDQKGSLDMWVDYLVSPDALYPTWFKYYTLISVTKMGIYDKKEHSFAKRTKDTTTIFPDLNAEALSYSYDVLSDFYLKHEKHDDEELSKILESANFSRIYAFAVEKVTPASKENKERTAGEWVKFKKGSDPTVLYESLQGQGTGWCTAGKETARSQLDGGDFYVYYSKDEHGKNIIPRIAIRMKDEKIAEVRGIDPGQNMEDNMLEIARKKYVTLPGGDKFEKYDHDMKLLTLIGNKVAKKQDLTKDELIFIYEFDSQIEGFGHGKDPRIYKIQDGLDRVDCFNLLTDEKYQSRAAEVLAHKIECQSLESENLLLAINYVYKYGSIEAMNYFVKAIINSDSSPEILSTAWNYLTEKGDESTALSLVNDMQFLDIENSKKAWAFIEEKGGDETANLLTEEIIRLTQLNREASQDSLDGKRRRTDNLTDEEIIELNQFNRDKILGFIDKKVVFGDMKTIQSVVNIFNKDIKDTSSLEIISELWKVFDNKGDSVTAELLARNILKFHGYNNNSKANIEKAWDFINKKGDKKSALAMVLAIIEKNIDSNYKSLNYPDYYGDELVEDSLSPSGQYKKIWDFVQKRGNRDDIAQILLTNINNFYGRDIETAWNYILDMSNGAKSAAFITSILGDKMTTKRKYIYDFIFQNGDYETLLTLKKKNKFLPLGERIKLDKTILQRQREIRRNN